MGRAHWGPIWVPSGVPVIWGPFGSIGGRFLFVSGSSLLVVSYEEKDKFTAQGLNDFIVFSTQGIGSLSAGFLLYFSNWTVINLLCVPLLIIVLVVSFISSRNN